jgi:hypothetical protein
LIEGARVRPRPNEIAHFAPDLQCFEHSYPAAIADSPTSLAASRLEDRLSDGKPTNLVARVSEDVGFGKPPLCFAAIAQHAHEPLPNNAA